MAVGCPILQNPGTGFEGLRARQGATDSGDFEIEVLALSEIRGPATVAQTLYRESESSREARQKLIEERRAHRDFNAAPQTRPSKRDRRRIIQFRGGA